MGKYTHLIERCSSFVRTGIAWRLKPHGYTFSEAYWRLREGKGLLSAYDQESLKLWSSLITGVRRSTAPLRKLLLADQQELNNKREELLEKLEAYRDRLEAGCQPQYLYDGISPVIIEYLLSGIVGDVRELNADKQQKIWESLDMDSIRKDAVLCMKEIEAYKNKLAAANNKEEMLAPEEWTRKMFGRTFVKDKVWQIRTGHDTRSSVGAGIGQKLNFIWDIPNLTDKVHRDVCQKNQSVLDGYKEWKEQCRHADVDYHVMIIKIHSVLDSIDIPTFA